MKIPALDLAAQYKELGEAIRAKINEDFSGYGLELQNFTSRTSAFRPEVEAAMDSVLRWVHYGDAQKYMQFQALMLLRDAAQNEGGGQARCRLRPGSQVADRWRMHLRESSRRRRAAVRHRPCHVRTVEAK
jgi:membrane protease subunit (stomatin/prohibitin family)